MMPNHNKPTNISSISEHSKYVMIDRQTDESYQGDGGDGGGGMEERIAKLEETVRSMETDLAVIKSNYATKTDLHQMEANLTRWMVGTMLAAAALAFSIAKFLH